MFRIRSLVNAELVAEKKGKEKVVQFGSGTYFEATNVDTYVNKGEVLADITLSDGYKIIGVVWNQNTFENHGVPEKRVNNSVPVVLTNEYLMPKESVMGNFEKLKEINNEERNTGTTKETRSEAAEQERKST